MKTASLFVAPLLLVSSAFSQQLVRGDVDSISGTNRFQLECTQIPLVSTTVNLQQLENISRQNDIEFEMMVQNVGTLANPRLNVLSATQIPEMFDMGNLRFGRSETWEVRGVAGSQYAVYIGSRARTRYLPIGPAGTLVLSPESLLLNSGMIGPFGLSQFRFTMPTIPSLVGVEFTSQAFMVQPTGGLLITNPDCKDVRN